MTREMSSTKKKKGDDEIECHDEAMEARDGPRADLRTRTGRIRGNLSLEQNRIRYLEN